MSVGRAADAGAVDTDHVVGAVGAVETADAHAGGGLADGSLEVEGAVGVHGASRFHAHAS